MIIRTPLAKRKNRAEIEKDLEKAKAKRDKQNARRARRAAERKDAYGSGQKPRRNLDAIKPIHPLIVQEILELAAQGLRTKEVAKKAGIGQMRLYKFLRLDQDFAMRWALARQAALEVMEEEILDIADDTSRDIKNGKVDKEHINRSRLRIEVRKWLMKIRAPRKYGEKATLDGPDGAKISFTMEFGNNPSESEGETIDGEAVDVTEYDEAEG